MKSRKVLLGLLVGITVCFAGAATAQKANYLSDKLVEIGPDNIGGRVTSIIVDGRVEGTVADSRLYAGAASGGLYTRTDSQDDLWEYIPCYVDGKELTLPISKMVKLNDSIFVIATGESYYTKGNKMYQMAALGRGIFLFNKNTREFAQIRSTNPGTDLEHNFASVNDMAFMVSQGTTYFFVATPKGLFRWNVNQMSDFNNAPATVFEGNVSEVVVSNQYNRAFFANGGNLYKISDVVNASEPVNISGSCSAFGANAAGLLLAIAPSDESFMYVLAYDKNGLMTGVYQSKNTNSWLLLSSNTVTPFSSAATAKTCGSLTVSPNDPQKIIIGGANIWVGKGYVEDAPFQWTVSSSNEKQLNGGNYMAQVYSSMAFVHSGIHQIVPQTIWIEEEQYMYESYYIATDGGVFSTIRDFSSFMNISNGMNSVQINGVAVLPDGSIISGANSNGCPFIEARMEHHNAVNDSSWYDPNRSLANHRANILWHDNGGTVAATRFTQYAPLSRRTVFVSAANASIGRAYADYADYTNTQTWTSDVDLMTDLVANGPAIGQIYLWETDHNTVTNDSITFVIDTLTYVLRKGNKVYIDSTKFQIQKGDSMVVLDKGHADFPFYHVFDHNFVVKNEMTQTVPAPYLSRMVAVTVENDKPDNSNVSYCWMPTDFRKVFDETSETRFWSHIYAINGVSFPHDHVRYSVLSQDGDCAFVVVENDETGVSFIARVHGLNSVDYSQSVHNVWNDLHYGVKSHKTTTDTIMASADNMWFNRRISSIAVDPREGKDAIIVTFDGFDSLQAPNVVFINNATASNYTISDISVANNLPAYSALIEQTSGNVFVGTEDGLFKANSASSASWNEYGAFKGVPVTSMCQSLSNYGITRYTGHDGVTEVDYVFPRTKWSNAIYIGTYGRGIFMDSTYVTDHTNEIVDSTEYLDIPTVTSVGSNSVRFYPNPAVEQATMELSVVNAGNAVVKIYDLTGKVVYSENLGRMAEGVYTRTIDCQRLQHGMYLVNVVVGNQKATSKLIVR